MEKLSNLPRAIRSSKNPKNVSLTIKGTLMLIVIFLAKQAGLEAGEDTALIIAEYVITIGTALITLFGVVRRIINKS